MSYLDELKKNEEGAASEREASLLNRFNAIVKVFPNAQDALSKVEEAFTFEEKITAYESAAKSNLLMHFQSGTDSALLHIKTPFWNKPTTATMRIEWDGNSGKITPSDIVCTHYPVLASKLKEIKLIYDVDIASTATLKGNEVNVVHGASEKILNALTDNGSDLSITKELETFYQKYKESIQSIRNPALER